MLEPLEIVLPARRQFKPRAFSVQWALEAACRLDIASPGFLSHLLYASDLKRQATFTCLAEVHANQAVAVRLRHVAHPHCFKVSDPFAQTARALIIMRPREIVGGLFGEVPDGLIGALARLGSQPFVDPDLYRELVAHFAQETHRFRANLLRQTSGELTEQKVRIALTLDPVFLHQNVFDSLHTTEQVEQLHAALDLIRKTVSTATDEALASSVRDLPVRPKLCEWAMRWLRRMDRPLVEAPLADDPDFMPLYGAALGRTARKYRNCLAQRVVHSAVGKHVYLEYLPEPGGVLELTRLTNGWVATEIDAAGRGELTTQTLAAIQSKLAEHGIPTFASALPSRSVRLVARLVNTWELTAQEMLCDPPAEEEEVQELAA